MLGGRLNSNREKKGGGGGSTRRGCSPALDYFQLPNTPTSGGGVGSKSSRPEGGGKKAQGEKRASTSPTGVEKKIRVLGFNRGSRGEGTVERYFKRKKIARG